VRHKTGLRLSTKILVLTVHNSEDLIFTTLRIGADGYIIKDASKSELVTAMEKVLAGEIYVSQEISRKVINDTRDGRKSLKSSISWDRLSQREREILKMIANGYRNKDIADRLAISHKTVEKHRSSLMKKLDLHSSSSITAYAIERGLITKHLNEGEL
jgi:DNA-binding NarL/FixJ family response regulator